MTGDRGLVTGVVPRNAPPLFTGWGERTTYLSFLDCSDLYFTSGTLIVFVKRCHLHSTSFGPASFKGFLLLESVVKILHLYGRMCCRLLDTTLKKVKRNFPRKEIGSGVGTYFLRGLSLDDLRLYFTQLGVALKRKPIAQISILGRRSFNVTVGLTMSSHSTKLFVIRFGCPFYILIDPRRTVFWCRSGCAA